MHHLSHDCLQPWAAQEIDICLCGHFPALSAAFLPSGHAALGVVGNNATCAQQGRKVGYQLGMNQGIIGAVDKGAFHPQEATGGVLRYSAFSPQLYQHRKLLICNG